MAAPRITNRILGKTLANRSISGSLDEQLLEQLDAQGANRSALVSEALTIALDLLQRQHRLGPKACQAPQRRPDQPESGARS